MKERWREIEASARDAQEQQFATWFSGVGISFEGPEAEKAYRERVGLLKDAIQLIKSPHRVPVCPSPGLFPIEYSRTTPYEAMYDYDTLVRVWEKYFNDFSPDAYTPPSIYPGKVFDLLDFTLYKWPGHGVSKERPYQFVEADYMKAEEYQALIDDPSGYFLRFYFPRIFSGLKSFERMPLFPLIYGMPQVISGLLPFGRPELQRALHDVMDAASEATRWAQTVQTLNRSIMGKGYPTFFGGSLRAPFDLIGDSLRGTQGIMMDMYRHADELLEACERLTPFLVKAGVATGRSNGHPLIFMPLHKGADGFMSDQQFRRFYWPTLRKVILGLINEGLVPFLFAEGGYNSRMEIISDLPRGGTVWWFEHTDMLRAKETLGEVACIAGNVPLPLLSVGTVSEVKDYCKTLIDTVGRNGGFILSTAGEMGAARPENVKAMIDFTKEYGICS